MKKFFIIVFAYFGVYLGFLFVNVQYYWVLEGNILGFFTLESFKEPLIPSILSTSLAILLAKIKSTKR